MRRLFLLALGFLMTSTVSVGQTASAESQTLQALLVEVRQLRKDLQTTTVASQRVQILLYRAQLQETVVAGAQRRLDVVHSKLAEVRSGVAHFASEVERAEAELNDYSLGETEARPQSSQRRYSTGRESDRPMTRALGAPHRGQTIPAGVRFAMK